MAKKPEQSEALLKEIRDNFDSATKFWAPIHKEGNLDVRFVAGDPWDQRDIEAREKDEQKRPHLVFDSASQYINALCGKERQRKRSIIATPESGKANKETAEKIQGRLRYIETKCKAQSKYASAFKDAGTRGYGWLGVSSCYSSATGREQEPTIRGFDNPDSVLMQPHVKEYDGGDARWCFVNDRLGKGEFKRLYAKFEPQDLCETDDSVLVTEYWKLDVKVVDRTLYLKGPAGETEVKESELPDGKYNEKRDGELIDDRDIEEKTVTKYVCQLAASGKSENSEGVEILAEEKTKWTSIPIVPVFGEKFYVAEGESSASAKVVYLSLIRRARDPMQLLNLSMTNAAEQMAMVPKTRYMGYEGQFEGHESEFANIGTNPLGYLQVKPITDQATGALLPLPRKENWEPAIQATMMLAEKCENQVRSTVGQIVSTELDKAKSGVALKRLNETGDTASFHLPDNFAMSMERLGCLLGEALHFTHDNDREVPIQNERGQKELTRINAVHPGKDGKPVHYDFTCADYGYTVSTGPSHQSQQEAVQDYITTLVQSAPELLNQFGDLYTEAQNLGPDAAPIVERFKRIAGPLAQEEGAPPDPAQMQAELQKGQQFIDLQTKHIQELQKALDGKLIEKETQIELQRMKDETAIKVAEINQAAKVTIPQIQAELDAAAQHKDLMGDAILQDEQHAHEKEMAANAQDAAASSQQAQQDHQAGMQDQSLSVQQQESEAARQAAAEQPAQA